MKSVWFAALLSLSAACAAQEPDPESGQGRAEAAGRALLGQSAPAVMLRSVDGEPIDLAGFYGHKPVYLKFWATWCVPCREQMPGFEKDFERLGGQIAFVAVNTGFNDKKDSVLRYRREHGLKMPVAIDDGTLAAALNLRVTPQHVVIGRDGRILYVGHLDDERLKRAFEQALAEPDSDAGPAPAPAAALTGRLSARSLDGTELPLGGADSDKRLRAVMFFSPWCESYLRESRPEMAERCKAMRETADRMSAADRKARWIGVASGLWASPKDLAAYQASKAVRLPLALDEDGALFRAFDVHEVPTIVLIAADGHVAGKFGPQDPGLATRIRSLEHSK